MVKRIAFTGPFAEQNFGDYAMLINNLYDLDVKAVTLFSYDDAFIRTIAQEYLHDFDLRIVSVHLDESARRFGNGLYPSTPLEVLSLVKDYEHLANEVESVDVLIVNGGGYFNSLWSRPHRLERLLKIIIPILVANRFKKKIFFTGNSFGPFSDDSALFSSLFASLENVSFCCRDRLLSPVWLRQLGVDNAYIKYVPDDLFPINERLLALPPHKDLQLGDYVVMECYLPVDYLRQSADVFRRFSEELYSRQGLSIVFLPFHPGHGGMNQAKYLHTVLRHFEYYDVDTIGFLPIQDCVSIIRNAKMVISNRYHALVVALGLGVPVVTIIRDVLGDKRYYYNKTVGMLNEVFRGAYFDERLYVQLDYVEALESISTCFSEIVRAQLERYDERYRLNRSHLESVRRDYINRIARVLSMP